MHLRHALSLILLLTAAMPLTAGSLTLPVTSEPNSLLQAVLRQGHTPDSELEYGVRASGTNNVGSIWSMDGDDLPAHDFRGDTGFAVLSVSQSLKLSHKGWWISYGSGTRTSYEGSADAAQLWIDMNSGGHTQAAYAPSVGNTDITASWFGIGRDFGLHARGASGTGSISIRRISASDFRARSIVGSVEGDTFDGMMRVIDSETYAGDITGSGWSLDAQVRLRSGDKWMGQLSVDGLLGSVSWDDLEIEDSRIVSPRTFTDPDGFLHDMGGISGAYWLEDRSLRINPHYQLDLVTLGRPNVLLGCGWQSGVNATPNFGVAWQQRRWMPYTRYYPNQGRLELGAVGTGWQVHISGDDWIYGSPKHAEVGLSATALRF